MADVVLAPVLRILGDIAGNIIAKEGSRLFKLKENILWIEDEMRSIQSYLDIDATTQSAGSSELPDLRTICDLAYDVEDIMEAYFPKLSLLGSNNWKLPLGLGWFSRAKIARDFALEIEEIKRRVEEINRRRQTYQVKDRRGCVERDTWDPRRTFPHIDEVNVIGLDGYMEELVTQVLDKDLKHRVVSITGMAGLGKTTLAKKVFNSVQPRFKCSAWIYVSQQPNLNELLQDIARQAGLTEDQCRHNLEGNLFKFLSHKRYVVVLDDIWHIEPWDALKKVIPINSMTGSRIIITSRDKYIGVQISGQNFLHELQPLDQGNSRKLFSKMTMTAPENNDEGSDSSQLKNIGDKILERCHGVPLAIIVATGMLLSRDKTKHAWQGVLKSMGQDEDQCSKIFALSYKDLPSKLKPCFLYFGLFPEDREISAFKIINLWAAEGFIHGIGTRAVEDVGHDYLNHLVNRNLIQVAERRFNGTVSSCRIHDIFHELCIREATKINFLNIVNDATTYAHRLRVRRVAIHRSNVRNHASMDYQTPKIRTMLSFIGGPELLRKLQVKDPTRHFKFLRVLSALEDKISMSFPHEIVNFKGLHLLELGGRGMGIIELPYNISNLKNLLTLDLHKCLGVVLPNVVWKMKQLRHILLPFNCWTLSLHEDNLDRSHPIKISLPNLQTLYGLPIEGFETDWLHKLDNLRTLKVYDTTEHVIEILSGITPFSQRLEVLELLPLNPKISRGLVEFTKFRRTLDLHQYVNLGKLVVRAPILDSLQLDKLPLYVTEVSLWDTRLKTDPMVTLKKLPKLRMLVIGYNSYRGMRMVCSGETNNFPQLEVLKIELQFLKEFAVEEGGMPRLKDLTFTNCNPATRVPDRIRNTITICRKIDCWIDDVLGSREPDL